MSVALVAEFFYATASAATAATAANFPLFCATTSSRAATCDANTHPKY
jgi:hypothetical protein